MSPRSVPAGAALFIAAVLLLPAGNAEPVGDGASAHEPAMPAFHRPTDAELSAARATLLRGIAETEQWLQQSPDGAAFADEVGLEKLKSLCQSDRFDLAYLNQVYRAMSNGAVGREEPRAVRLRAAVADYATLLRSRISPDVEKDFLQQIRELRTARENFAATGSPSSLTRIRSVYAWLVDHGQAADLQKAISRDFSHPNVLLWVDQDVMNSLLPPPATEPVTIDKNISGVAIRGQGEFTGNATIAFRPNSAAATIEAKIVGDGANNVSATRGKATVYGNSSAHVTASQAFHLTAEGLTSDPPQIDVDANYEPTSADFAARVRLMRRLGKRIAMRVARRQQPQATEDMRQEIAQEFEARLKKEVVAFLDKQNEMVQEKYRLPMARWDMPCNMTASTEKNKLRMTATLGKKSDLGAPHLPPVSDFGPNSLHLAVYDSAINNLQFTLAGQTISEDDFQDLMFKTLGLHPMNGKTKPTGDLARITLSLTNPLSVTFDNGAASVAMRIVEFSGQGKLHTGTTWTVKTKYVPRLTKTGVEIDRVEPISITSENGKDVAELREVLASFLVDKANSRGLTTVGELARLAQLKVHKLEMRNGWLVVTMRPSPLSEPTNGATPTLSASNKEIAP